uniref:Anaphase-promoting complex subunit 4 n=1 Tax=Gouania willdenowi TaxID=441366 RepID=A0A8C5NAC2_GOUWI
MPAFRQVGEKQLPNPVLCMAWSPKRDLIALANTSGELLLHRLANFQRVWSLQPSEYTWKEITLAWRPDGKILAFSLGDTKQVVLCSVEKAEILHVFPVQSPVSCMHWMEVMEESSALSSFYNSEDKSKMFLPKLPTLPKRQMTQLILFSFFLLPMPDSLISSLLRLNVLVLGGGGAFVELYAYGMYKIATLGGVSGMCRSLSLSSDLKSLSIITEVRSADDKLDTGLLSSCLPEVTRMARKFTHISTLLQYVHLSLTCMCEAWEDILTQMDLRLTKFVQEKNTSTQVQDEFLELLLWGQSRWDYVGLKKLGQSIESSYSSIQKLVINHLQSGSEALLYHLSEVKGMSLWKQKFEPLGLDSAAIEGAITAVGSFSLKANELLQVIDKSMKNFKAFFRWLYVGKTSNPLKFNSIMTQKDISFVADFLSEHFSKNEELFDRKGKYFNVERVGQYLKDEEEDLVSPPNTKGNQWLKFLQESKHLKESPLLFPSYPQKSLHFVKRMMENVIEHCLQKPAEVIGKSVTVAAFFPLYTVLERYSLFIKGSKTKMHYVVFCMPESSPSKLYLLRRGTDPNRCMCVIADLTRHTFRCLDARFYDDEMLTVVLQGSGEQSSCHFLAQLPLASCLACETQFNWDSNLRYVFIVPLGMAFYLTAYALFESKTLSLFHTETNWRELESMKAQFVAVNGIRKVSCVLSSNLRHIRVFEMDVEDEDDEGADSQNASTDQDGLETTLTSQGHAEESVVAGGAGEESEESLQKTAESLESEEALELS